MLSFQGYRLRDLIDRIVFIDHLKRQDFRILDGIPKVLIIVFNNNEKQTLWDKDIGLFQRRRTYRVETRGQDAILSYWFNTDEIAGGLVDAVEGAGSLLVSSCSTSCWIYQTESIRFPECNHSFSFIYTHPSVV